ncbi:hypothetical protein [Catenuloplanes atrovinosus]|uniref:Uncharacterized protein YukE n=1 Tax=Catenuloplanes atrovinosus TaxID=137266 RepID=A0AAE4C7T5_9ACTN|nr:hypothetical protein [Catenuloplanes atrovinosus]MDR7274228.1 uncharacterized protein YukE [Catenuloplanes atrovinosus]
MADGALHPDPANIDALAGEWDKFAIEIGELSGALDQLINAQWNGDTAVQSDRVAEAIKTRVTEIRDACTQMATSLREMAEEVRKAIQARRAQELIERIFLILTIVGTFFLFLTPFFAMIGNLGRLGAILSVVGRALNVVGDLVATILSRLPMVTAAAAENIGAFVNGVFWAVGISFGIQGGVHAGFGVPWQPDVWNEVTNALVGGATAIMFGGIQIYSWGKNGAVQTRSVHDPSRLNHSNPGPVTIPRVDAATPTPMPVGDGHLPPPAAFATADGTVPPPRSMPHLDEVSSRPPGVDGDLPVLASSTGVNHQVGEIGALPPAGTTAGGAHVPPPTPRGGEHQAVAPVPHGTSATHAGTPPLGRTPSPEPHRLGDPPITHGGSRAGTPPVAHLDNTVLPPAGRPSTPDGRPGGVTPPAPHGLTPQTPHSPTHAPLPGDPVTHGNGRMSPPPGDPQPLAGGRPATPAPQQPHDVIASGRPTARAEPVPHGTAGRPGTPTPPPEPVPHGTAGRPGTPTPPAEPVPHGAAGRPGTPTPPAGEPQRPVVSESSRTVADLTKPSSLPQTPSGGGRSAVPEPPLGRPGTPQAMPVHDGPSTAPEGPRGRTPSDASSVSSLPPARRPAGGDGQVPEPIVRRARSAESFASSTSPESPAPAVRRADPADPPAAGTTTPEPPVSRRPPTATEIVESAPMTPRRLPSAESLRAPVPLSRGGDDPASAPSPSRAGDDAIVRDLDDLRQRLRDRGVADREFDRRVTEYLAGQRARENGADAPTVRREDLDDLRHDFYTDTDRGLKDLFTGAGPVRVKDGVAYVQERGTALHEAFTSRMEPPTDPGTPVISASSRPSAYEAMWRDGDDTPTAGRRPGSDADDEAAAITAWRAEDLDATVKDWNDLKTRLEAGQRADAEFNSRVRGFVDDWFAAHTGPDAPPFTRAELSAELQRRRLDFSEFGRPELRKLVAEGRLGTVGDAVAVIRRQGEGLLRDFTLDATRLTGADPAGAPAAVSRQAGTRNEIAGNRDVLADRLWARQEADAVFNARVREFVDDWFARHSGPDAPSFTRRELADALESHRFEFFYDSQLTLRRHFADGMRIRVQDGVDFLTTQGERLPEVFGQETYRLMARRQANEISAGLGREHAERHPGLLAPEAYRRVANELRIEASSHAVGRRYDADGTPRATPDEHWDHDPTTPQGRERLERYYRDRIAEEVRAAHDPVIQREFTPIADELDALAAAGRPDVPAPWEPPTKASLLREFRDRVLDRLIARRDATDPVPAVREEMIERLRTRRLAEEEFARGRQELDAVIDRRGGIDRPWERAFRADLERDLRTRVANAGPHPTPDRVAAIRDQWTAELPTRLDRAMRAVTYARFDDVLTGWRSRQTETGQPHHLTDEAVETLRARYERATGDDVAAWRGTDRDTDPRIIQDRLASRADEARAWLTGAARLEHDLSAVRTHAAAVERDFRQGTAGGNPLSEAGYARARADLLADVRGARVTGDRAGVRRHLDDYRGRLERERLFEAEHARVADRVDARLRPDGGPVTPERRTLLDQALERFRGRVHDAARPSAVFTGDDVPGTVTDARAARLRQARARFLEELSAPPSGRAAPEPAPTPRRGAAPEPETVVDRLADDAGHWADRRFAERHASDPDRTPSPEGYARARDEFVRDVRAAATTELRHGAVEPPALRDRIQELERGFAERLHAERRFEDRLAIERAHLDETVGGWVATDRDLAPYDAAIRAELVADLRARVLDAGPDGAGTAAARWRDGLGDRRDAITRAVRTSADIDGMVRAAHADLDPHHPVDSRTVDPVRRRLADAIVAELRAWRDSATGGGTAIRAGELTERLDGHVRAARREVELGIRRDAYARGERTWARTTVTRMDTPVPAGARDRAIAGHLDETRAAFTEAGGPGRALDERMATLRDGFARRVRREAAIEEAYRTSVLPALDERLPRPHGNTAEAARVARIRGEEFNDFRDRMLRHDGSDARAVVGEWRAGLEERIAGAGHLGGLERAFGEFFDTQVSARVRTGEHVSARFTDGQSRRIANRAAYLHDRAWLTGGEGARAVDVHRTVLDRLRRDAVAAAHRMELDAAVRKVFSDQQAAQTEHFGPARDAGDLTLRPAELDRLHERLTQRLTRDFWNVWGREPGGVNRAPELSGDRHRAWQQRLDRARADLAEWMHQARVDRIGAGHGPITPRAEHPAAAPSGPDTGRPHTIISGRERLAALADSLRARFGHGPATPRAPLPDPEPVPPSRGEPMALSAYQREQVWQRTLPELREHGLQRARLEQDLVLRGYDGDAAFRRAVRTWERDNPELVAYLSERDRRAIRSADFDPGMQTIREYAWGRRGESVADPAEVRAMIDANAAILRERFTAVADHHRTLERQGRTPTPPADEPMPRDWPAGESSWRELQRIPDARARRDAEAMFRDVAATYAGTRGPGRRTLPAEHVDRAGASFFREARLHHEGAPAGGLITPRDAFLSRMGPARGRLADDLSLAQVADHAFATATAPSTLADGVARLTRRPAPAESLARLTPDQLSRVRETFHGSLRQLRDELWAGRPGEFARRHDAGDLLGRSGDDPSPTPRWNARLDRLAETLPARIEQEHLFGGLTGQAATEFDAVMGGPGRHRLPDATYDALADRFRSDYVTAHREMYGIGERETRTWLGHEAAHENGFGTRLDELREQAAGRAWDAPFTEETVHDPVPTGTAPLGRDDAHLVPEDFGGVPRWNARPDVDTAGGGERAGGTPEPRELPEPPRATPEQDALFQRLERELSGAYARRVRHAAGIETRRPDLAEGFDDQLRETGAAFAGADPRFGSLHTLPAGERAAWRSRFVADGDALFERVWEPVLRDGAPEGSPAWRRAEADWEAGYQRLRAQLRLDAFHRHQIGRHHDVVARHVEAARTMGIADHDIAVGVQAFARDVQVTADSLIASRPRPHAGPDRFDAGDLARWDAADAALHRRLREYVMNAGLDADTAVGRVKEHVGGQFDRWNASASDDAPPMHRLRDEVERQAPQLVERTRAHVIDTWVRHRDSLGTGHARAAIERDLDLVAGQVAAEHLSTFRDVHGGAGARQRHAYEHTRDLHTGRAVDELIDTLRGSGSTLPRAGVERMVLEIRDRMREVDAELRGELGASRYSPESVDRAVERLSAEADQIRAEVPARIRYEERLDAGLQGAARRYAGLLGDSPHVAVNRTLAAGFGREWFGRFDAVYGGESALLSRPLPGRTVDDLAARVRPAAAEHLAEGAPWTASEVRAVIARRSAPPDGGQPFAIGFAGDERTVRVVAGGDEATVRDMLDWYLGDLPTAARRAVVLDIGQVTDVVPATFGARLADAHDVVVEFPGGGPGTAGDSPRLIGFGPRGDRVPLAFAETVRVTPSARAGHTAEHFGLTPHPDGGYDLGNGWRLSVTRDAGGVPRTVGTTGPDGMPEAVGGLIRRLHEAGIDPVAAGAAPEFTVTVRDGFGTSLDALYRGFRDIRAANLGRAGTNDAVNRSIDEFVASRGRTAGDAAESRFPRVPDDADLTLRLANLRRDDPTGTAHPGEEPDTPPVVDPEPAELRARVDALRGDDGRASDWLDPGTGRTERYGYRAIRDGAAPPTREEAAALDHEWRTLSHGRDQRAIDAYWDKLARRGIEPATGAPRDEPSFPVAPISDDEFVRMYSDAAGARGRERGLATDTIDAHLAEVDRVIRAGDAEGFARAVHRYDTDVWDAVYAANARERALEQARAAGVAEDDALAYHRELMGLPGDDPARGAALREAWLRRIGEEVPAAPPERPASPAPATEADPELLRRLEGLAAPRLGTAAMPDAPTGAPGGRSGPRGGDGDGAAHVVRSRRQPSSAAEHAALQGRLDRLRGGDRGPETVPGAPSADLSDLRALMGGSGDDTPPPPPPGDGHGDGGHGGPGDGGAPGTPPRGQAAGSETMPLQQRPAEAPAPRAVERPDARSFTASYDYRPVREDVPPASRQRIARFEGGLETARATGDPARVRAWHHELDRAGYRAAPLTGTALTPLAPHEEEFLRDQRRAASAHPVTESTVDTFLIGAERAVRAGDRDAFARAVTELLDAAAAGRRDQRLREQVEAVRREEARAAGMSAAAFTAHRAAVHEAVESGSAARLSAALDAYARDLAAARDSGERSDLTAPVRHPGDDAAARRDLDRQLRRFDAMRGTAALSGPEAAEHRRIELTRTYTTVLTTVMESVHRVDAMLDRQREILTEDEREAIRAQHLVTAADRLAGALDDGTTAGLADVEAATGARIDGVLAALERGEEPDVPPMPARRIAPPAAATETVPPLPAGLDGADLARLTADAGAAVDRALRRDRAEESRPPHPLTVAEIRRRVLHGLAEAFQVTWGALPPGRYAAEALLDAPHPLDPAGQRAWQRALRDAEHAAQTALAEADALRGALEEAADRFHDLTLRAGIEPGPILDRLALRFREDAAREHYRARGLPEERLARDLDAERHRDDAFVTRLTRPHGPATGDAAAEPDPERHDRWEARREALGRELRRRAELRARVQENRPDWDAVFDEESRRGRPGAPPESARADFARRAEQAYEQLWGYVAERAESLDAPLWDAARQQWENTLRDLLRPPAPANPGTTVQAPPRPPAEPVARPEKRSGTAAPTRPPQPFAPAEQALDSIHAAVRRAEHRASALVRGLDLPDEIRERVRADARELLHAELTTATEQLNRLRYTESGRATAVGDANRRLIALVDGLPARAALWRRMVADAPRAAQDFAAEMNRAAAVRRTVLATAPVFAHEWLTEYARTHGGPVTLSEPALRAYAREVAHAAARRALDGVAGRDALAEAERDLLRMADGLFTDEPAPHDAANRVPRLPRGLGADDDGIIRIGDAGHHFLRQLRDGRRSAGVDGPVVVVGGDLAPDTVRDRLGGVLEAYYELGTRPVVALGDGVGPDAYRDLITLYQVPVVRRTERSPGGLRLDRAWEVRLPAGPRDAPDAAGALTLAARAPGLDGYGDVLSEELHRWLSAGTWTEKRDLFRDLGDTLSTPDNRHAVERILLRRPARDVRHGHGAVRELPRPVAGGTEAAVDAVGTHRAVLELAARGRAGTAFDYLTATDAATRTTLLADEVVRDPRPDSIATLVGLANGANDDVTHGANAAVLEALRLTLAETDGVPPAAEQLITANRMYLADGTDRAHWARRLRDMAAGMPDRVAQLARISELVMTCMP